MSRKECIVDSNENESVRRTLPMDPAADRLMALWEVAMRIRCNIDLVRKILALHLMDFVKVKSHQRVSVSSLNEFLFNLRGKDLYEVIKDAEEAQAVS